ncbi:MFS transporter [Streptomyces sp. NRRL F-5126]|uniref:MFS transporter n=1 Tax=Streptomyces sp. NRRL F-5126 TaxID=1463857 RepID=UPI00068B073C|nr:MFS transporter [Streptomyces sp. NRRL F-5126]
MPTTTQHDTPDENRGAVRTGTVVAALVAVCLAQIGLAMPATLNGVFQEEFHPVGSQLTWISDCSLLPITVLELTFGVLGDLFGRKRLLMVGALLLAIGEAVSASADGVHVMWAGQIVAGLGCAALFPTSLAMLMSGSPAPGRRARMIALWAAILSTGNFLAPLLGGLTATYATWRWAFIVVVVLAVVGTGLSWFGAQESTSPEGRSLDPAGQTTIGIGLCALLFGVIQGASDGWRSPLVVTAFIVAALSIALFIVVELRVRNPLLRLGLFRNRAFAVASAVTVIGMFAFLGTAFTTSLRMGPVQHQSSLRIAVAFLLLSGLTIFLMPLTARLMATLEPRWVLGAGFVLMAVGDFLAGRLPVTDSTLPSLIVPLGLVGVGFSLVVSSVTETVVGTVPHHLSGMASATTSMLRDFGFTLGPAVIGAVAAARSSAAFTSALAGSSLPSDVKAAAGTLAAQTGSPLPVEDQPATSTVGKASDLALHALGHGYAVGYVVCGAAALACCLFTLVALRRASEAPAKAAAQPATS